MQQGCLLDNGEKQRRISYSKPPLGKHELMNDDDGK